MIAQLGPYFIDEELAEGGMARVFRARLRGLGGFEKTLVLKQIKPELAKDPHFVELFVREANTLVLLSHPHIVPVYELFAVEGNYYFSMEYVQGATVQHMLRHGPLSPGLVAHLGVQVAEALHYAHTSFEVLHRDLTPRNIIVDKAGHARLLDFGIASTRGGHDESRFGSPGYMSPEQVRREPLGAESDLFSLGAVLREALTGLPAFEARPEATLGSPKPLTGAPADAAPLLTVIGAMLQPEPEERPRSAREVAQVLRAHLARAHPGGVIEEMQTRVRRAQEDPPRPRPTSQRPPQPAATQPAATQPIAMNPALTEIMRSSGGSAKPTAPPTELGTRPVVREGESPSAELPAASQEALSRPDGPGTRPLPGRGRLSAQARSTRAFMKAWPGLAALALVAAFWLAQNKKREPEPHAKAQGAAAAPHLAPAPASSPQAVSVAAPPPAQARKAAPLATRHAAAAQPLAEPTPNPDSAPTPAPSAAAQPRARPPAKPKAQVSINALPWAEVSVDGKRRGVTPLRALGLAAGSHTIELKCPPLGVHETLRIALSPDQTAKVVVDLTQSPAVTFLEGARASP